MNASEIAQRLIFRAKNLKQYIVTVKVPRGILFKGKVPFDIFIDSNNIAEVTVFAIDADEAHDRVREWLDTLNDDNI